MVTETDLALGDGRTLHVYDTGAGDRTAGLAVFWQHGTPSTGAPPEPLFAAAAERGIRWVSHDRPGYGGSTPHPGRDVASAAADVARIADALGIGRTPHGWRSAAPRRKCGYAQTTDTSRSSTPASWPWTGSASTLVTVEPEPGPLTSQQQRTHAPPWAIKRRTTSRADLLRARQPRD